MERKHGSFFPSKEIAMEKLGSSLAHLEKYNGEYLIPSSISTLFTVAKDFPCLISSPEYQSLRNLANTKTEILENHEAKAAKKQGNIFRDLINRLREIEEKNHESSGLPMLTQDLTLSKDTSSIQRNRIPTRRTGN